MDKDKFKAKYGAIKFVIGIGILNTFTNGVEYFGCGVKFCGIVFAIEICLVIVLIFLYFFLSKKDRDKK